MLVIPALLSLKSKTLEKPAIEMLDLIKAINKKLKDS